MGQSNSRKYPTAIAHMWPRKLVFGTRAETTAHTNRGDVQVGILVDPRLDKLAKAQEIEENLLPEVRVGFEGPDRFGCEENEYPDTRTVRTGYPDCTRKDSPGSDDGGIPVEDTLFNQKIETSRQGRKRYTQHPLA